MTIYIIYGIIFEITALCSYFSAKNFTRSVKKSFEFLMLYTVSSFLINTAYLDASLGKSLVIAFVPLAFFGFLKWLKSGQWLMLSTGLTMLLYSQWLAFFIMFIFLLFMLGLNLRSRTKLQFINLGKTFLLTLTCGALVWIPFLYIISRNIILSPYQYTWAFWSRSGLSLNFGNDPDTLLELAGVFLVLAWRHFSRLDRQLWVIAMISLLLNPLMLLTHLLFTFLLINWLTARGGTHLRNLLTIGLILWGFFGFIDSQFNIQLVYQHRPIFRPGKNVNVFRYLNGIHSKAFGLNYDSRSFKFLKHSVTTLYDYVPYRAFVSRHRYFTAQNFNHYQALAFARDGRLLGKIPVTFSQAKSGGEVIKASRRIYQIRLPIVYYYGFKYIVKDNGHSVRPVRAHQQLVALDKISSGKHLIQVYPQKSLVVSKSFDTTLWGWVIDITLVIKEFFRRYHENFR